MQEPAGVADSPVDRLGPDAEQSGDGDLRQGQAMVEGDGQEPVGAGEHGAAAGAGSGQPRAVTAAGVEARFRCWSWSVISTLIRARQD
jgi:hypothetical protein